MNGQQFEVAIINLNIRYQGVSEEYKNKEIISQNNHSNFEDRITQYINEDDGCSELYNCQFPSLQL